MEQQGFWDKYGKPIGVLAALIAVGVFVIGFIVKYVPPFPRLAEERMVSKLVAGDDYTKLRDIIGTDPDRSIQLKNSSQTYKIFSRRWEYLTLLVDRSDTVLSVGVWATNPSFKVTVGYARITVNGPSIAQLQAGPPIGAWGSCGASYGEYFEGYGAYEAIANQSSVAGAWSVEIAGANFCSMLFKPDACLSSAYKHMQPQQVLSQDIYGCITDSSLGRQIRAQLSPSVVIITKSNQPIISNMLIPPIGPWS